MSIISNEIVNIQTHCLSCSDSPEQGLPMNRISINTPSEWVIVVSRQFSNFSAISWREQVNLQWDDDDARFVLDQHAELDFYSASSLKQQSTGRHVAPLRHVILIPSQPVFALSP
jgi:hypothetical protein